jgi:hypothetical protein
MNTYHPSLRVLLCFAMGIFLLSACKPERMDDCFTPTGPEVEQERNITHFHSIELYNNINLVIEPGNMPTLRLKGGKNLLSSIETEVKDSTLTLRNLAACNWMRDYKRALTVYVTASTLRSIRYEGSGDITMPQQLKFDSLRVDVLGGAGSFHLNVETEKLGLFLHYGTVDFNVEGKAIITSIFANSYGPFYCNDLISNIIYIRNSGTNDCYVSARHILEVEITSVGNIYYSGDPYQLKSNITGSGKLIKKD